ncbi:hypothetical protein [Nocardia sp. NPDC052112]|uniref:hypothetical protein n=1 Tax=Nocardia sp. NPDC052112 TaxID=3155646 RepID=UPI0034435AD9
MTESTGGLPEHTETITVFDEVLAIVGDKKVADEITAEAHAQAAADDPTSILAVAQQLAVEQLRFARFRQSMLSDLMIAFAAGPSDPLVRALFEASRPDVERCLDALESEDRDCVLESHWEGARSSRIGAVRRLATLLAASRQHTDNAGPPDSPENPREEAAPGHLAIEERRYLGGTTCVAMPEDMVTALVNSALDTVAAARSGNYSWNIRVGDFMVGIPNPDSDDLDTKVEPEWRILERLARHGIPDVPRVFKVLDGVLLPDGRRVDGVQIQGFVADAVRLADMDDIPVDEVVADLEEFFRRLRAIPVKAGEPTTDDPEGRLRDPGEFIRELVKTDLVHAFIIARSAWGFPTAMHGHTVYSALSVGTPHPAHTTSARAPTRGADSRDESTAPTTEPADTTPDSTPLSAGSTPVATAPATRRPARSTQLARHRRPSRSRHPT